VKWPAWLQVLAFFSRIARRQTGELGQYGERTEERAAAYLTLLDAPRDSLKFKIGIINLEREFDVLDEEEALHPGVLALQLKVIDMAMTEPLLSNIRDEMGLKSPASRLFWAILDRASAEGIRTIRVLLNRTPDFPVLFDKGEAGYSEATPVPSTLALSFRGIALRTERMGFRRYLQLVGSWPRAPRDAKFVWADQDVLEIHLVLSSSAEESGGA
jgi:hypothetical protein